MLPVKSSAVGNGIFAASNLLRLRMIVALTTGLPDLQGIRVDQS
jgi:hypothetical protein